ncbi:MAG: glutamyl-tRNA synthetase, partial [Thermoleophilia bacterium]|nr:glutamyl-tRNA synthetase [Thermoleophilia bacterium]
ENELIGDFVIARSDGTPLYNFANVVDDADMRITHVIRGNDHLNNTPKQILIYRALGEDVPAFAHLPMVLGPDGAKLSKRRHHTSSVEQLAEAGYAPVAVRNGLALIGWSKDGETEFLTNDDLISAFEVSRVKKSPGQIDYTKLLSLNGDHLRGMSRGEWAEGYERWRDEWLPDDAEFREAAFVLSGEDAAELVQEKVATWGEVPAYLSFLLEPFTFTDDAWTRLEKSGETGAAVLSDVTKRLEALVEWELDSLEAALRAACESLELKPGKVFGPVRFAASGRTIAPGLWELLHALGRERSLDRLRAGRDRLTAALSR